MSDTDHDKHTDDTDHDDLQPFPTLQRCFEAVDPNLGFNVEVKYPQEKKVIFHGYSIKKFISGLVGMPFISDLHQYIKL